MLEIVQPEETLENSVQLSRKNNFFMAYLLKVDWRMTVALWVPPSPRAVMR
ncbi:hypothetical protein CCP3SC1AL1_610005 [Gammaproteobacteria bacterium]